MLYIDYTNAPAGAGKTYGATSYMKERITKGEKVILVQPIKRLIGETVEMTFARQGIDPNRVTEISERTHPNGGIVRAIVEHIKAGALLPPGHLRLCPSMTLLNFGRDRVARKQENRRDT